MAAADASAGEGNEGAATAEGAAQDAGSPRPALVRRLVAFLKQYHLRGADAQLRALLYDVASDGRRPLEDVGAWGVVRACEVREALATFELWKEGGRPLMPAYYQSRSQGDDLLPCVITKQHDDGRLDLRTTGAEEVKRRADPSRVVPRDEVGWFVPSPPPGEGGPQPETAPPIAEKLAYEVTLPAATAMPAARLQASTRATPVAAVRVAAAAVAAPAPAREVWRVFHDFDGSSYGQEYLVLRVGDELERLGEDSGWTEGRVLRPGAASTAAAAKGSAAVTAGQRGWYPGSVARSAAPAADAGAGPAATLAQAHVLAAVKSAALCVTRDFDGAQYGEEYLVLRQGDELERVREEDGWTEGRVVRPGAASVAALASGLPAVAVGQLGWYPGSFAV